MFSSKRYRVWERFDERYTQIESPQIWKLTPPIFLTHLTSLHYHVHPPFGNSLAIPAPAYAPILIAFGMIFIIDAQSPAANTPSTLVWQNGGDVLISPTAPYSRPNCSGSVRFSFVKGRWTRKDSVTVSPVANTILISEDEDVLEAPRAGTRWEIPRLSTWMSGVCSE